MYGSKLYSDLEAETGVATGYRRVGSVTVARTADRLTLLKRNAARAAAFGIDAHIISASEAAVLWPHMRVDDLAGALYLPNDATITSSDLTASLSAGAKQNGANIFEETSLVSFDYRQ